MSLGNWLDDVLQFHTVALDASSGANHILQEYLRGAIESILAAGEARLRQAGTGAWDLAGLLANLAKKLDATTDWEPEVRRLIQEGEALARKKFEGLIREVNDLSQSLVPGFRLLPDHIERKDVEEWCSELSKYLQAKSSTLAKGWRWLVERINSRVRSLVVIIENLSFLAGDWETSLKCIRCELSTLIDSFFPVDARAFNYLSEYLNAAVRAGAILNFVEPGDGKDLARWAKIAKPILDLRMGSGSGVTPVSYYPYTYRHLDRKFSESASTPWSEELGSKESYLYAYLEEDVTILAGRLHKLEREWAEDFFVTCKEKPSDSNAKWVTGLASLGSILHTVEDFFAHSTFVEFALPYADSEQWDKANEWSFLAATLARRRQKWSSTPGPAKEDTHIATGFFSPQDAALSLLEPIVGMMGLEPWLQIVNPQVDLFNRMRKLDDVLERPAAHFLGICRQIAETFLNLEEASEDKENHFAAPVRDALENYGLLGGPPPLTLSGDYAAAIGHVLSSAPAFRWALTSLEPETRAALVRALTKVVFVVVHLLRNAAVLIRWIRLAIRATVFASEQREKLLESRGNVPVYAARALVLEPTIDFIRDQLTAHASFKLTDSIIQLLGGRAVGSHSLISKDDAHSLFYDEAVRLATATDWSITAAMVRLEVSSSEVHWERDWRGLLGRFLRHPLLDLGIDSLATANINPRSGRSHFMRVVGNGLANWWTLIEDQLSSFERKSLETMGHVQPYHRAFIDPLLGTHELNEVELRELIDSLIGKICTETGRSGGLLVLGPGRILLGPPTASPRLFRARDLQVPESRTSVWWWNVLQVTTSGLRLQLKDLPAGTMPFDGWFRSESLHSRKVDEIIKSSDSLREARERSQLRAEKRLREQAPSRGHSQPEGCDNPCAILYIDPYPHPNFGRTQRYA